MSQNQRPEEEHQSWATFKSWMKRFWNRLSYYWTKFHLTKIFLIVILLISLVISSYMAVLAKNADVKTLQVGLAQTTTIKDRHGEDAGVLYSEKGTYVELEQISPHIQKTVIAVEDRRFKKHHGFDPIGIARAALGSLVHGHIVGGGSTITQQLAKNAYLTADQTLARKLKELFLAIEIEKKYSKDEILEMYLNHAYFGSGVWGVEDASKRYFGKSAADVTIGEAAVLAGILKAPSLYNPIENYDQAVARRNTVLQVLVDVGYIEQDTADAVAQNGIALENAYYPQDSYQYPYYFDAVIEEAVNKYGIDEDDLINNGYTIYTALDQTYQQKMDQAFEEAGVIYVAEDGTAAQSASLAIDPKTGGINALIGGSGDYTYRGFNRATQMRRQPASVIKPLGVYTPALEKGYEINDVLIDEVRSYGEDGYTPENFNFEYQGTIPMYEAVAQSKNTSAVWLLNEIGVEKGYQKLKEFGIPVTEEDHSLGAVALGGMERGTTLVEIGSAYSTFANDGVRNEPHLITKIVDASGAIIVNNERVSAKRVMSSSVNDDMNQMLIYVYDHPFNAEAEPSNYEIAGKTGTSETPSGNGATDQWIVGYTPDIVVVTWAGFDETNEDHYLPTTSIQGVGALLRRELAYILPYTEQNTFDVNRISQYPSTQNETTDEGSNLGDQIRQGLEDAGRQIQKGAEKFFNDATNWWNQIFGQ